MWVGWGYSMAFTGGRRSFVGGFSKAFLKGVDATTLAATFSNGVYIPEYMFVVFQMTFACITPALIVGGFAERMKFCAADALHRPLADYRLFPDRAHGLVLGGPGLPRRAIRAIMASCSAKAHWISPAAPSCTSTAGIAGLMGCLVLGKRLGYKTDRCHRTR